MKKILFIGNSGCGKTTLTQCLNGMDITYQKTQTIQVHSNIIDTPGEYLENRALYKAIIVTAVEADVVAFVQDATSDRFRFSPGQASMFQQEVIGIVTKADLATTQQMKDASSLLELAGADKIFDISAVSGQGVQELLQYMQTK